MVTVLVTGVGAGSERIEIIKDNFETEVCNNMPVYPLGVWGASGSTWKNGKFSICGGLGNGVKSDCYTMDKGEWQPTKHNLITARGYHGSSNIGNAIFITGGWSSGPRLASTEIVHPDGKITPGPELPQGRYGHCQVSYEETTFILGKCIFCKKFVMLLINDFDFKLSCQSL